MKFSEAMAEYEKGHDVKRSIYKELLSEEQRSWNDMKLIKAQPEIFIEVDE